MRGPKGQGYSETLRQKDRADFSDRNKEVPPCILCVYFGCAPESTSFLFCLLCRQNLVSENAEESVSVMREAFDGYSIM